MIIWLGVVQTVFKDEAFLGKEAALIRVLGMAVAVIGWLYLFGGLSGDRRIVAATVSRWCSFLWSWYPWQSREFFPIFLWRLQF